VGQQVTTAASPVSDDLHQLAALLSAEPPSTEALDTFVATRSFPLVDGRRCLFVYRGEAEGVHLMHRISWLPPRLPLTRAGSTPFWHLAFDLPETSRIEYKFEVTAGGTTSLIEDPLNPHHARDPFGTTSVVHGAGYETPEWTLPDPETRPGSLQELLLPSRALGRDAHITLYRPARYRRERRYPLLIVHDGGDFLRYAGMKTVLDNLTHRLELAEMLVAFTHPVQRLDEYAADPRHAQFIADELLPWLAAYESVRDEPSARGLMGASFGAVATLALASSRPQTFGRLALMSGSFAFTDIGPNRRGAVFDPVVKFMNGFREKPVRVAEQVFVSCGAYEPLIYENRSLIPLLIDTGMEVRYAEARDGHNWENWRDRLRDGLTWLFPGQLWMVYE
jgi:enterochelin esterase-like enzyme